MRIVSVVAVGALIGGLIGYFGKCVSGTCPLTSNPYIGALFGALIAVLFFIKR